MNTIGIFESILRNPDLFAVIVEATIPIVAGVFATLLGHRVIGKTPGTDFRWDAWHQQYGMVFKVLGPFMVLFGIFLAIVDLLRSS
ncbi:hypothetical protein [Tautonia rosea]|uniref:hypothetical protein n=1 Tax=Tautonia rosea TaxID=2728037 RepID=UPI001475F058|nr:hypothetical protein [Tautonia rosea]